MYCIVSTESIVLFGSDHFGTSGKLQTNGSKKRMCDFAIRLSKLVEAGDMTGYFCQVQREIDSESR